MKWGFPWAWKVNSLPTFAELAGTKKGDILEIRFNRKDSSFHRVIGLPHRHLQLNSTVKALLCSTM